MSLLNYFSKIEKATPSRKRKLEDDGDNTQPPDPKRTRQVSTGNELEHKESVPEESVSVEINCISSNDDKTKSDSVAKEQTKDPIDNKSIKKEKLSEETKQEPIDGSTITYSNCEVLLDKSWKGLLGTEFEKPYFKQLKKNLAKAEQTGKKIFPPIKQVFRCFELCPREKLKVVILGQDPYHDNGQAEGLCFSVAKGIAVPSSLQNMYKEAKDDIAFKNPGHGSLVHWGMQGVLLLNTALTVEAHKPNSHSKFGWHEFTDSVIKAISKYETGVVFILWGKEAQKKASFVDLSKHKIIQSAHPSGLSARRGFFGSKPFSQANKLLEKMNKETVDWQIPI